MLLRSRSRFYTLFKAEHDAFLGFITGLARRPDIEWYASVMLNRLMFVYFIQKKGFLDGDRDYLRNRLRHLQRQGQATSFTRSIGTFSCGYSTKVSANVSAPMSSTACSVTCRI